MNQTNRTNYHLSYYENNKTKIRTQQTDYKKRIAKQEPWRKHRLNARDRCYCKSHVSYKTYGGRGIECFLTVEDTKILWFRDKAYLMTRPSIDRKNDNGNYTFDNCRFIEFNENAKLGGIKGRQKRYGLELS